jgi:hypothetical protein
LKNITRMAVVK